MARKIKITEEQFNEFVDKDGAIGDGDRLNNNAHVKTNAYPTGGETPETTDDFADATAQDSKWYFSARGFSFSEGVVKEAIMGKSISNGFKPNEKEAKKVSQGTMIPDVSELSASYQQNELQSQLKNIGRQLSQIGASEEDTKDIKAIILKEILTIIDVSSLLPQHLKEIQKLVGISG